MNNILKAMGALGLLVLLILLWPRSKSRTTAEASRPATNAVAAAGQQVVPRALPRRPRSLPGQPSGQPELQVGFKAELARILGGEVKLPALAPAVVERYLERHQRNAESLLGAFRATQNPDLLKEAAARYPDDPTIQLAVLLHQIFPEQRREWLDRFKQSAPDNSLASYLSAREHFEAKDLSAALADLAEATGRPRLNPYLLESMQSAEELFVAGGQPALLAKAQAMFSAPMGHLAQLKQLSSELVQLGQQYRTANDLASAGAVANMGLMLAARLNGSREGQFIIDKLVGITMENQVWTLFDPSASSHYPGLTVQARQEELARQRDALKNLTKDFPPTLLACSDDEIIAYMDRAKVLGEVEALRWLKSKQPVLP